MIYPLSCRNKDFICLDFTGRVATL